MSEPMRDRDREVVHTERRNPSPVLIAIVLVAVAALIFVLSNGERVEINFLAFDVVSRVWVAITIALAIGALLDRLVSYWWRRSRDR